MAVVTNNCNMAWLQTNMLAKHMAHIWRWLGIRYSVKSDDNFHMAEHTDGDTVAGGATGALARARPPTRPQG